MNVFDPKKGSHWLTLVLCIILASWLLPIIVPGTGWIAFSITALLLVAVAGVAARNIIRRQPIYLGSIVLIKKRGITGIVVEIDDEGKMYNVKYFSEVPGGRKAFIRTWYMRSELVLQPNPDDDGTD